MGDLYYEGNSIMDENLITANSAGGLEWARDILQAHKIYKPDVINSWYNYYSTGNPDFYSELLSGVE